MATLKWLQVVLRLMAVLEPDLLPKLGADLRLLEPRLALGLELEPWQPFLPSSELRFRLKFRPKFQEVA